jgi:hypothetical protein
MILQQLRKLAAITRAMRADSRRIRSDLTTPYEQ